MRAAALVLELEQRSKPRFKRASSRRFSPLRFRASPSASDSSDYESANSRRKAPRGQRWLRGAQGAARPGVPTGVPLAGRSCSWCSVPQTALAALVACLQADFPLTTAGMRVPAVWAPYPTRDSQPARRRPAAPGVAPVNAAERSRSSCPAVYTHACEASGASLDTQQRQRSGRHVGGSERGAGRRLVRPESGLPTHRPPRLEWQRARAVRARRLPGGPARVRRTAPSLARAGAARVSRRPSSTRSCPRRSPRTSSSRTSSAWPSVTSTRRCASGVGRSGCSR